MAKLRPAGRMQPFNLFLRPADLLLPFKILPNRHLKASKNDKLEKKLLKNFSFAEIVIIYQYTQIVQPSMKISI